MAHVGPSSPTARRWRRLVGVALVVVGLIALFAAVVSLRNPKGRGSGKNTTITTTPKASRPKSTSAPRSTSAAAAQHVDVYILNNSNRDGLAAETAEAMRAKGWPVAGYENYSNDIVSSCAYYDPSDPANQSAAQALRRQFPGIKRVVARFAELPQYPIVVVLNADYS